MAFDDRIRNAVETLEQEYPDWKDLKILQKLGELFPSERMPDLRTVGRWRRPPRASRKTEADSSDSGAVLPQVLLAEVERIRGALEKNGPTVLLEPIDGLQKKRQQTLRAYTGMGTLAALIDGRENLRLEYEQRLDALSKSLRRELDKISNQMPALFAWDEQVVETLERRAFYWEPGKPVPEHRRYTPDQSIDFIRNWGEYSLTSSKISPALNRRVLQYHQQYRKYAEQFLQGLTWAMAELKQANNKIIDELEHVIHSQELRTMD